VPGATAPVALTFLTNLQKRATVKARYGGMVTPKGVARRGVGIAVIPTVPREIPVIPIRTFDTVRTVVTCGD
jgi:hypothetical protein